MTAQICEILIIGGERTSMAFCPPLPEVDGLIVIVPEEQWEERDSHCRSTACWRRYQGVWEIRDGSLWLVSLAGGLRLMSDRPILADWFTGVMRVPQGEMLAYVHMGFGSVYERELHIKVESGRVVDERVIDNTQRHLDMSDIHVNSFPGGAE